MRHRDSMDSGALRGNSMDGLYSLLEKRNTVPPPWTGRATELRYATSGLYVSISDIMRRNHFKAVEFVLQWEEPLL